ncbi:rRNA (guanine-N(2)-)-methyltransferase [Syntrophobotulus glycolicus DSM 8271]|uniref:rRNA (Guanine-N(2)-)-methyltransferase n=1 Tax=Syntrophobotulus glycolicus (strain DSM 8271 / FlGlyR) TaxID=645991 RepID=F0T2E0_SYNGF|nr:class I SAM-dependent RNA methyltransferase [Syntrophobotulus glycolicus]ADY57568.1 rRNA (guanine-N(2)-)-methyltransferase [Syntrophobotulus glycolicus DSM 8271]
MAKIELIATSAFGLEAIVAREIAALGYERVRVDNGKVYFAGDESAICRSNLWLRSADRVLINMGEFEAKSFEELFQKTKALPWEEWLNGEACFPVDGKSVKSKLFSVSDCQAIVKKAIVERLKECYGISWFEETGPVYRIQVALLKDKATLTIDTSGKGLHKRGYRELAGEAPLKESLAAALISLSRWKHDRALIDPFCGTGTIPIEAAMIAQNRAPGLKRDFAAESWPQISPQLWIKAREEAEDLWQRELPLNIFGSDIDSKALSLARIHSQEAGFTGKIFFQRLPVKEIGSRFKYGHIITNPPYGLRLNKNEEVENSYRELGGVWQKLETWSLHVLTALPQPELYIGKRWDKSRKLYNGRIECHLFQFFGPKPPSRQKSEE